MKARVHWGNFSNETKFVDENFSERLTETTLNNNNKNKKNLHADKLSIHRTTALEA